MNEQSENMNQQPQVQTQYQQPQPQVQTQYQQPQPQVQTQYQQPQFQAQTQYQQPQFQAQTQYQQPQPDPASGFYHPAGYDAGGYANGTVPGSKPKKRKKGLIITLSAIVALIVAGLLVFFLVISPKLKHKKAGNVVSDAVAKTLDISSPTEEYLGLSDLISHMSEKPYETEYSLNIDSLSVPGLESLSPFLTGISLTNGYLITDPDTEDFQASVTLNYSVLDLTELNVTYLDDSLALAAPGLFDGYLYASKDDLDKLTEDMLSSLQAKMSAMDMSSFEDMKPAFDTLIDSAALTSVADKTLRNAEGSDVTCKGYAITVSKDNMLEFLQVLVDDIIEVFRQDTEHDRSNAISELENAFAKVREVLTSDFVMEFYINNDGYLMEILVPDYTIENMVFGADCTFLGADNVTDQIDFTFHFSAANQDIRFRVTKDTVTAGSSNTTTTAAYVNDQQLFTYETTLDTDTGYSTSYLSSPVIRISTSGSYSNVKKGSSFQYSCDYITLEAMGLYVSVSGTVHVAPTQTAIRMPSGTGYNITSNADREKLLEALQKGLFQNPVIGNLISSFMTGF